MARELWNRLQGGNKEKQFYINIKIKGDSVIRDYVSTKTLSWLVIPINPKFNSFGL